MAGVIEVERSEQGRAQEGEFGGAEALFRRRSAPLVALLIWALIAIHLALVLFVRVATEGARPWWAALPRSVVEAFGAIGSEPFAPASRWRWLFSSFLHHDWVHVIANVLVLRAFGRIYERLVGTVWFGVTWLAAALGASVLAAWRAEAVLGASGAIMGIVGALSVYSVREPRLRRFARRLAISALLVFAAGVAWNRWLMGLFGFGISNAAHVGGWLVGLVCGALAPRHAYETQGRCRRVVSRALRLAFALAVVSASAVLAVQGARAIAARLVPLAAGDDARRLAERWDWVLEGPLQAVRLPELGWEIELPQSWRVFERSHGYVAIGPRPGEPRLQILSMEFSDVGSRWSVPEVIVSDLRARHPDLIAAPFEASEVDGLEAVRIDMVYRQRDGAEVEQVRYLVSDGSRHAQFVFLGETGEVDRVARRLIARAHRLRREPAVEGRGER